MVIVSESAIFRHMPDHFRLKKVRNAEFFAQIKLFLNQKAYFLNSSVALHKMLYGPLVENH